MFFPWLYQDVHEKQPFESPPEEAYRRKAFCVHVARLRMEVLQVRWAVSAQALPLGGETLSVSRLREEVCSKWPLVQTRQGASVPAKQPLRPLRELIGPAFPFPPSRPTAADDSTLLTIFLVIIYLSSHNSQCCYLIPPCLSVPCPLKMIWEWSSFWVRGGGCSSFFVFFFFLRMLFSFPPIFPSFAAASFGNYSVLFLAVFCCTWKCKSCLLLVNYSPGIPEGFAHVQAIHCEFLLSCSICPVWKQQIPFEMKTTPLFLGCLSQGFVGAGHRRRNSGSRGEGEARHGGCCSVPPRPSHFSSSHLPFPQLGLYINIYVYIFIHIYMYIFKQRYIPNKPEAQAG